MLRGARAQSLLAFCLALFVAQPAPAQQHGGYSVGPNCPGESEFWALVESHLRNPSARDALPVRVEASELEGQAQARVTFGNEQSPAARELSAATCLEAVQAAALVVALALDARAQQQQGALAPTVPPPRPPPNASPPRTEPRRVHELPDSAPRRVARRPSTLSLEFGAGALIQQAIAPTPLFGAAAFAGLGHRDWAADARLGVVYAQSGTTENGDASAEFALLAGQLETCGFALLPRERFVLEPCLAVQIGRVESRGVDSELYAGRSTTHRWGAFGPLLRARHAFGQLWLEAYAGPWIPFLGPREFVFEDPEGNHSFHEVAAVGFTGGLAVALRLD
jgi:hypothetical protein